jgi:acetyl esterase
MISKLFDASFRLATMALIAACFASSAVWGQACQSVPAQPADLPGAQSYTYKNASGRDLRVHVFGAQAQGRHPAILFFFGGGWQRGSVTQFTDQATATAGKGYVAALADYRVLCRDGTSPVDALADAEAAYTWLRQQAPRLGIDPRRIVLSGGSAGGHLAAATALLAPQGEEPAALVLFNPALDLGTLGDMLKLAPVQIAAISPSALPIGNLPPTVIFHGAADKLVPIATIRAFCTRATAAGRRCELHEYEGQGHGFFNSRNVGPALGASYYEDTLSKSFRFLASLGID